MDSREIFFVKLQKYETETDWNFFCYVNKINETFPKLRSRNMKCSVTKPIDGKLVILQTVSTILNVIYSTLLNGKWFSLENSQKSYWKVRSCGGIGLTLQLALDLLLLFFLGIPKKVPFANSFSWADVEKSWNVVKTFNSLGNTHFVIFVYVPNPKSDSQNSNQFMYDKFFPYGKCCFFVKLNKSK